MSADFENLNLQSISPETIADTADTLVRWLRTFWTKLYKDKNFIKYLQGSRALRLAQLYLDILENASLLDHTKAPVFHRERWYPIVLRENRKNEAEATVARVGHDGILLKDPGTGDVPEVVDGFDKPIKLGEHFERSDTVAYSLSDDVKKVVSCIVDNIADPKIVLYPGVDFEISRKSIILKKSADPFSDDSGFPVFEVPETPDSKETREAVLWASDVLIDKDYVFKHVGYAVGLETASDENSSRLVKTVWDATTDGLSMEHLHTVLGALCGVQCIKDDVETVESIYSTEYAKTVVTDKNAYSLAPDAELADNIRVGNSAHCGDFLDTSVRIYPFVVDVDRVKGYSGFEYDVFKRDVSSLDISSALISGDGTPGFYVGWGEKSVIYSGRDSNGNPKLRFDLDMESDKEDSYWNSVWAKYEKLDRSMEECFDGLNVENVSIGCVCGTVTPIKFFMKNLVGANTLIIVVDTDRIPEDAPLYDPNFFHALRKLVPEYVRMYFIEHGTVVDDEQNGIEPADEDGVDTDLSIDVDEEAYSCYDNDVVTSKWTKKCRNSEKYGDDYDD